MKMPVLMMLGLMTSTPTFAQGAATNDSLSPASLNFEMVICAAHYLAVIAADYPSITNSKVKFDTADLEAKAVRLMFGAVKIYPEGRSINDTHREIEEFSESLSYGFGGDDELKEVRAKTAKCDLLDTKYGLSPPPEAN
jgi:hypothetical protein